MSFPVENAIVQSIYIILELAFTIAIAYTWWLLIRALRKYLRDKERG